MKGCAVMPHPVTMHATMPHATTPFDDRPPLTSFGTAVVISVRDNRLTVGCGGLRHHSPEA
jgi:hypothetical protein